MFYCRQREWEGDTSMEMGEEEEDKEKLEEKLKQFEDDLTTYGNFDFFLTFYFFVLFV